jgi:5-methylcytosine-specific restriction endonuclease McrA
MAHAPEVTGWRRFRSVAVGKGRVVEADGRHRRRNGRPLATALSFEGEEAWTLATRLTVEPEADPWDYRRIIEASPVEFTECPICGEAGPLTAEHVPPERLGGAVLTTTCRRCNNIFGSYEDALLQRAEQRCTMAIRGPGIAGERRVADVILRMTSGGEIVLTTWNGDWPDWTRPLFTDVGVEVQFERRCPCLAYAAMLKNGFLAACALNPTIVTAPGSWPVAQMVREQLLAWLTPTENHLEIDPRLRRLRVRYDAPIGASPGVALCEATHRATGERAHVIRLGWQLAIDWPVDAAQLVLRTPSPTRDSG